ncbi:unnamed protein product [Ilex paraguariensis]|uniref:PNPLA domain-containing protein n=1 Tax=Ilex paraguariensis TaxID=185542 RepID=A0ABC8TAN2_9AQUA
MMGKISALLSLAHTRWQLTLSRMPYYQTCISMSAAPTYFPAYYFKNTDEEGKEQEFKLIDGGVDANNPTLVAISEVTKQVFKENPDFFPIKPMDYGRFLVISIGTGSAKNEYEYNSQKASKWGILNWHFIQKITIFESKDDTLNGTLSSVDVSTKENMQNLEKVGEELLKKNVSRFNVDTGKYEPVKNGGTNVEALKKIAKKLSDEIKLRESKYIDAHQKL